jgi:hypothetical protein
LKLGIKLIGDALNWRDGAAAYTATKVSSQQLNNVTDQTRQQP